MQRFASVVVVDARGWLLMQERDEHPVIDPDKWGLPGGHVEPGEDVRTAAHRELEEETGIRLDGPLHELGVFLVDHHGDGRTQPVHAYAAHVDLTDDDVECREGRQMVFVDPARLTDLALGSGASAILPSFLASATYREMHP